MKKILISTLALSLFAMTTSCDTEFETDVNDIVVSQGEADFSKYVSLGNSLTSGYRDGTLYLDGQNESYPSMIAAQMKLAGGGDFKQPLMPNNVGGFTNLPGFPGKLTLQVVNGSLAPVASPAAAALDNISSGAPYQNLGVPGAKVAHLIAPGYGSPANLATGTANPFFTRFATSTNTSVVADALAQNPTFLSLWIGNNDVLGYATSGGDGSNPITPVDGTVGVGFTNTYNYLVNTLFPAGTTRKGVIANIPYVTTIPFFNRVPFNPLTTTVLGSGDAAAGAANVTALNSGLYGPLKQALTAFGAGDRINLLSATQANPLLIKDTSLPNLSAQLTAALTPSLGVATATAFGQIFGQARQATSQDLVLLTTSSVIGTAPAGAPASINKYGISFPLENKHILTKTEVENTKVATDAYNAVIKSAAEAKGLAFVDANAKMAELSTQSGILFDGVRYTATFVTGGTFSLDGVHLTGRGYALIANEFMRVINQKYKSTLPMVNVNDYSGVTFP